MDVRGGARAGIVRAWLQAVEGNDKGKVFDLSEGNVWVIGRGHSADVTVMDIKASRAHCRLERIGDSFYLQDLNSTNGTYVNGQQIERQLLSRGDYIKVGYTILTFQYETAEEAQGAAGMAGMPAGAPFVPLPAGGPPPPPVVPPPPFAGGLGIPAPAIPAPGYPPLPPPAPGGALPLPPAPGAGAPGAEPWPAAAGMPALPPHPSSARTDAHEPASWWPQPQLPPPPACPPPARPPGGVPAGTPAAAPPLDLDLDLSALEGDDDPFATPQGTATWQGEAERVAPPLSGGYRGRWRTVLPAVPAPADRRGGAAGSAAPRPRPRVLPGLRAGTVNRRPAPAPEAADANRSGARLSSEAASGG
ncbi:MAG: hypothetical protein KatS3mg102_0012 [Planctomycetota bacterium]|nr:MAG: hypothetical protein KatS3mg102_0012 [Planctomycetota bacterium]